MQFEKKLFHQRYDTGFVGKTIFYLYKINNKHIRRILKTLIYRLIGKQSHFYSVTLRNILREYHGVDVGLYSMGACTVLGYYPSGIKIGRYCSLALTSSINTSNHPLNNKSSHAFFFNPGLHFVDQNPMPVTNLEICNDVWIGDYAVILPSCSRIGNGAVISAGAVVNKDIPDYAVVAGNPARLVRYRFSEDVREELLTEKWWEKDIETIAENIHEFLVEIEPDSASGSK